MKKIAFVSVICFVLNAFANSDFSQEVVQVTTLTPTLYMLEGAGGNMTASIGPDGVLLVDDDFAPMAEKILSKLKELKGASPRFIINTHFHYDHTGGNEIFGSTATIIAATAVHDRLMTEQTLWKKQHPAEPPVALPILTFDTGISLHLNSEEVRVVHLASGHTDGDSVVFFQKNKVVSMGDLYFAGMYPIFHPEHRGSLEGYARNIAAVLTQIPDDEKIVPGHGPMSTKLELQKFHSMIIASIATVRTGIKAGRTLEEIKKRGLDPKWEPFSHGYLSTDQWISLVYQNL